MKIGKKSYLLLVVVLALLLGSIPFLSNGNAIKASSDEYKVEIIRVQEYNKLVVAKLSIPKLSGQKIQLKSEGSASVHVDNLLNHLDEKEFDRLSMNETEDSNVLDVAFVDDGKSFEADFVVEIDKNSQLKEGYIQLLSQSGKVLAEAKYDIPNQTEAETPVQPESDALAGIAAFGLTLPTPGVTANVTTWSEFKTAMESTSVDWINVKADLTADAAVGNVTISKVINGDDNGTKRKIDMGSQNITLGSAAVDSRVIFSDIDLIGSSVDPMVGAVNTAASANWTVATNNVNVLSGNARPFAHLDNGTIQLSGDNNFQSGGFVLAAFLRAKTLSVEEDANVEANLQTLFFETLVDGASFNVDNAKMNIWIDAEVMAVRISSKQAKMAFVGAKTDVTISGNLTSAAWSSSNPNAITATQGAVVAIWEATREASDAAIGSEILVDNGAKVTFESRAVSKGAPTLQIYSKDSKIVTNDGAEFMINSESSDASSNGAMIRYDDPGGLSFVGNHLMQATNNSKIAFNKNGGPTPAVRMYGDENKIDIQSGSDFILRNIGDGVPKDPGANNRNQGIQYRNGNAAKTSSFSVTGENSNVSLVTDNGAAIDCNLQELDINAGEGTYFIVRGQTLSNDKGVFSSSNVAGTVKNKLTFTMNKPKYFDFRNNCAGGGLLFAGAANSEFKMTQSDLQVWDAGSNLDGNPSDAWSLIDSIWTTEDFNTGVTTNGVDFSNFKGAPAYSRMTANNQKAVIDELRVPTDADKYIWGHATVPEGKYDPIRAAFTGEVGVRVSVSAAGSVAAYTAAGTVVEDPAGSGAVSVYGDDARTGIFKIPTSNGGFLVKGQQIKVESAWRGALADEGGSNVHISEPTDIQTPQRTVLDVTPPQPTRLTDENLNNATNVLSGTGAEANATVYVYYDSGDRSSGTLLGTATVQGDGSWTYPLPYYLTDTKELSVYLGDNAIQHVAAQVVSAAGETPVLYDQTGLIKPPATNQSGGNINPYTDYAYHDAVFEGVKKYIVADVLPNLPVMTKTVVSESGSTTDADVGEELTYTLTAKNNKPSTTTTVWKDVVITDTLPNGLTFTPATAAVTINGASATHVTGVPGVNEYSYDEGTRLLTLNVGNLNSTESAVVVFKATVSGTASGSINNTATALGESPRFVDGPGSATGIYEEVSASDNALVAVAGTLSITSVPDIDFKIEEAKLNKGTRVIDPDITGNLVVADNRVTQKSWTLKAKLLAPMKALGETDARYILEDAIRYNTGTEEKVITADGTTILTYTHPNAGEYNVNSRWSSAGEGFKFYIDGGKVNKLGKYEAVLEFTLEDTPIAP